MITSKETLILNHIVKQVVKTVVKLKISVVNNRISTQVYDRFPLAPIGSVLNDDLIGRLDPRCPCHVTMQPTQVLRVDRFRKIIIFKLVELY